MLGFFSTRLLNHACQTRRRRAGFTLLELLIVIGVLAMLLAILLPSLRAAKIRAKRAACQSNQRQIVNAWHAYFNENQDRFLQGVRTNINFGGRQGVPGYRGPKPLNQYLGIDLETKSAEMFLCPCDEGTPEAAPTAYEHYGNSYITNTLLVGENQVYAGEALGACQPVFQKINDLLPKLNRSRIHNESKLLFLGDHGWSAMWDPGSQQRTEWHGERSSYNMAFLDGHVRFLKIQKGLHVTPEYNVLPFESLINEALACQQEVGSGE